MPLRAIAAVLVVIGCSGAQARDRLLRTPWWLYDSPHFSVLTNLPDDRGREVLADLELFRAVVIRYMGLGEIADRLPTRAVVFATPGQFARVTNRPQLRGYTQASLRGTRMVSSGGLLNPGERHVMFHEYVHCVLRTASDRNHPTWYDEGLADLLSTVHVNGGRVVVGAPPPGHVGFLRRQSLTLPLADIVHRDDLLSLRPALRSVFYARSWALVSYLHHDRARRDMLGDYLDLVARGVNRPEAFEAAFGESPRLMQRHVDRFLKRRSRPIESFPAGEVPVATATTRSAMADREVVRELAFLAVFDNTPLARDLVSQMLAVDPDDPVMRSALAITYQADESYAQGVALARSAADTAMARGLHDPVIEIDLGDMLMVWNDAGCDDPGDPCCVERYREAARAYRRALAIAPDNPEAGSGLAWALFKLGRDLAIARAHLEAALAYLPYSPRLHYRLGVVLDALGQPVAARGHLQRALYWSEDDDLRRDAAAAIEQIRAAGPATGDADHR